MTIYEVPNYFGLSPMFSQCPPFMTCPPFMYLSEVDQLRFERDTVVRFVGLLEVQLKAAHRVIESIDAQLEKV